ncbi:MAG: PilZ domain-containing protein [Moraxellaceae bacterium]|nr:PilZ domain-containing protein [Moraxellaceae bacterium]MDZ4387064.1 PilZ domain-containing protein [Moraxellaceae bacterium]
MMNEDEGLDQRFNLQGRLPAAWRPAQFFSANEFAAFNDNNLTLFTALSLMDMSHTVESEDNSSLHADFVRVETKLGIMMSMLSRLMAQHQLVPSLAQVTIADRYALWHQSAPWQVDDMGVLELYIDVTVAVPLQLPAKINADGAAVYEGLSIACLNGLEKFLFRQHRRSIADARSIRS